MASGVQQIYGVVNSIARSAMGKAAVSVVDTGSMVSLGEQVMSTRDNVEGFFGTLSERIGDTYFAIREYKGKDRSVRRKTLDYGLWRQKVSYEDIESEANRDWNLTDHTSPYEVEPKGGIVQNIFGGAGSFGYLDAYPVNDLFTAFTNATAMGAFISGLYTRMANKIEKDGEDLDNIAVATNIAIVLSDGKDAQKRNIWKEFKTLHPDTTLTVDTCLKNFEFQKMLSYELGMVVKRMADYGQSFNASSNISRSTKADECVIEVLADEAEAAKYYLQADTYHDELVKMPRYEEVNYWQGHGTGSDDYTFGEVSKISIQNGALNITAGGILAFVHDVDSCVAKIDKQRAYSIYDQMHDKMVIGKNFTTAYDVDKTENAVVFYIADEG